MSTEQCDHKYTYLREERQKDSNRYTYYDVYFCERCLTYQRVVARKTEEHYDFTETTYRRGEVKQ